jgi:hypothetical protein
MLGIKSDERFEKVYVAQLERLGVERIADLLQAISDEEGGKDLALLCYEDVHAREVCHRRMFARWWTEQTGQEVPELQQYCDPVAQSPEAPTGHAVVAPYPSLEGGSEAIRSDSRASHEPL